MDLTGPALARTHVVDSGRPWTKHALTAWAISPDKAPRVEDLIKKQPSVQTIGPITGNIFEIGVPAVCQAQKRQTVDLLCSFLSSPASPSWGLR
jgi:hypothetical protein